MAIPEYIRRGIIVSDKGFLPGQIKKELEERPDLHFLTPIKRNGVRIANNGMPSFEGVPSGVDDHVLYRKRPHSGRYLYAYKSARKAAAEEASYLARREKQKDFQLDAYEKKRSVLGMIVGQ